LGAGFSVAVLLDVVEGAAASFFCLWCFLVLVVVGLVVPVGVDAGVLWANMAAAVKIDASANFFMGSP
jgi:hypothetical protein